jgi:thiosulfate/3-mercaptopyruvate sulfurtransferase
MIEPARRPIVSAVELLEALGDPRIRIADVRWFLGEPERGLVEHRRDHIPGAVFVDLDRDLAAPPGAGRHPLPDPVAFADRMGELGFGDEHTVVIHDSDVGQFGARMWWMLDRLGHRDVLMLDGGLKAWKAVDGPMSAERSTRLRATMTLATEWPKVTDRQTVAASKGRIDLVDVRAPERYRGEVEPMEKVAGHIPGARNQPCGTLVDAEGCMKPAGELETLVRGEGERAELPLVLTCGSGVTACFGMLAARIAGLPDPILYPGSFSDWVGNGMPVATGPEPEGPLAG